MYNLGSTINYAYKHPHIRVNHFVLVSVGTNNFVQVPSGTNNFVLLPIRICIFCYFRTLGTLILFLFHQTRSNSEEVQD